MTQNRIYRTEAIVLKSFDLGEADRILTLYTPDLGKLRATAKGIRRIKSRKAGHLDLFMRTSVLMAVGRNLDIVTQAETIESFRAMREDLWRTSHAHYVAELVDAFAPERLPNALLYGLTVVTLRSLASDTSPELALRAFEVQLLGLAGYRPQLHRCLHCDAVIQPAANHFSPRLGGVLCPSCTSADRAAPPVSTDALKAMRNLQTNTEGMLALRQLEPDIGTEVERLLQEYIAHRLESRPRSLAFLDRLRAESPRI